MIVRKALEDLLLFVTSGRRYQTQNPYTIDEVKAAIAALEKPIPTRTAARLAVTMHEFAPLRENGLAEEIWSALRRHGENRLADALTDITNVMREDQYEVSK